MRTQISSRASSTRRHHHRVNRMIGTLVVACVLFCGGGGVAYSQGTAGGTGGTTGTTGGMSLDPEELNNTVGSIGKRAVVFLRYMREEVEETLNEWFFFVAGAIFVLIAGGSFVIRLHESEEMDPWMIGRFLTRFVLCAFLLVNVIYGMNKLMIVGKQFAYGAETESRAEYEYSWLGLLAQDRQEAFDESYERFTHGLFTVKINGRPTDLVDPGNGTTTLLGITRTGGVSIESITANANPSQWEPATLFRTLSFTRLGMEMSNIFNMFIWHFVMMFLRLFAPFAIAVAVDARLARRMTWNWLWGTLAISLVMPAVSQVLRIVAYTAGGFALQVGDNWQVYNWDRSAMVFLRNPMGTGVFDPSTIILIGIIVMGLAAALQLASVVIAYQITLGRVYETTSGIVGGWIATAASAGVGIYSAAVGQAINQQADRTQVQGNATAERTVAGGQRDAANQRDTGNAIAARASSSATATQQANSAFSESLAARERAQNTHQRAEQDARAGHERVLTESGGRTAAADVEAQNAANQQRSGLVGGIFADIWKGDARIGREMREGAGYGTAGNSGLAGGSSGPVMQRVSGEEAARVRAQHSTGQRHGAPRAGDGDGHDGMDFGRAHGFGEGARIGAAAGGTVEWAEWRGRSGNSVGIRHADGSLTSYSHLQHGSFNHLQAGQGVGAGEYVGRVGNTGTRQMAPHLHFGTRDQQNREIDPATVNLRPVAISNRAGVNPDAAMATQTGQAIRVASGHREEAVRVGSEEHMRAFSANSEEFAREEQRIAAAHGGRSAGYARAAHVERVEGINTQESMSKDANRILYDHGVQAAGEREAAGLEAARLRAWGNWLNSVGQIGAHSAGRIGDQFRY